MCLFSGPRYTVYLVNSISELNWRPLPVLVFDQHTCIPFSFNVNMAAKKVILIKIRLYSGMAVTPPDPPSRAHSLSPAAQQHEPSFVSADKRPPCYMSIPRGHVSIVLACPGVFII